LIERYGYVILGYHLTDEGACPKCRHQIPGIWPKSARAVNTGSRVDIFRRRPVRVSI
jgi:hypothetical protein